MTDFHRTAVTDKGEHHVTHQAKAPSAGSSMRQGSRPGRIGIVAAFACAFAAFLGIGASAAIAAPPTVTLDPVTIHSIVTAHATGEVSVDSEANGGFETFWCFEASPEGREAWSQGTCGGPVAPAASEPVAGDFSGLVAETPYEARISYLNFNDFNTEFSNIQTFETDPAVAPVLALGTATGVTATSAHVSATIDPEGGNEDAVAGLLGIPWELQINKDGEGWGGAGGGELTGTDAESEDPVTVEAEPTGLVPNSHYQFRLVVHYAGVEEVSPDPAGAFITPAVEPTITTETLFEPTSTSIQLRAQVDPHNATLTDCHFVYGIGVAAGNEALCESMPGGNGPTAVAANVSGLTPSAEYQFKLVASNAGGTEEGDVRAFTALGQPAGESCSNQEIREAQHATQLPECRAWEKTTPFEKGHGDIIGDGETNFASTDGDAITFSTRTPFGDTVGSGVSGQTQYVTRRSAGGWAAHSITPQPAPASYQTFFGSTLFLGYSDDLRNALVWGYDFPGVSGDVPQRNNIYTEENASRALTPVTALQPGGLPNPPPPLEREQGGDPTNWGVSADARHVAFVSEAQYLPQATPGKPNVYQSDNGVLSLVGILPDGTIPASGSTVIGSEVQFPLFFPHAMSANGSRELFASPPKGLRRQLYQRIDGDRTVWVSEPEGVSATAEEVKVLATTPDGRTVLFTTRTGLLPEDTDGGVDLYRWTDGPDPAHDLTLITHGGGFEGSQVVGVSNDGNRIYYQTLGASLVVWDHGTSHSIIAPVKIPNRVSEELRADAWPGFGRITPNGRYFAFITRYTPSGVGPTGQVTYQFSEMYLYDLKSETLRCISCPSGPATSDVTVGPQVTGGAVSYLMPGLRPRFLSDDGKVFFSTAEALVPEDTNGVLDAYEYDPAGGKLSLLSSGRGSDPATFAAASASGDDAFFVTRQHLVPSDSDDLVDLYDSRVGGGFPESTPLPTVPCSEEGCQPPAALPPAVGHPTSHDRGAGNVRSHQARCRHQAKKGANAKRKRCIAKKGGTNKRHAKGNRRTGK